VETQVETQVVVQALLQVLLYCERLMKTNEDHET
jgi:hypothetical protein